MSFLELSFGENGVSYSFGHLSIWRVFPLGFKIARYSSLIARYSISRGYMLNFSNFARRGAICEIACYIALKLHSVSALFFQASWFHFFVVINCNLLVPLLNQKIISLMLIVFNK
jgi:hypothetical protein